MAYPPEWDDAPAVWPPPVPDSPPKSPQGRLADHPGHPSPTPDETLRGAAEEAKQGEWRIWGLPGTGKTSTLAREIRQAVYRRGATSVLVASHTRAAAAELAGRDLPLPRDRVGTLHAFCWRALGCPQIAESPRWLAAWDETVPPMLRLGHGETNTLDDPLTKLAHTDASRLLSEWGRLRMARLSLQHCDPLLRAVLPPFVDKWEARSQTVQLWWNSNGQRCS